MKYGKRNTESELIKSNFEMAELNEKKLIKKGAKAERKRIIKLLEAECDCNDLYTCTPHYLIALIKGGK